MANKTVTIKRAPVRGNKPKKLIKEAKHRIGASLLRNGGGRVATGLTLDEERLYLPDLIGIQKSEAGFGKAVQEYFSSMTLDVPDEGLPLNIGLTDDGEPENVFDYIRYKFALTCQKLVKSEDEMGRMGVRYYIEDVDKVKAKKVGKLDLVKKARRAAFEMEKNPTKIEMVLRILSDKDVDNLDDDDRDLEVEELLLDNPESFLSVVHDELLEHRAFLAQLVKHSVIAKEGNSYIFGSVTLGHTEEDAARYLDNPENSEILQTLKAKNQVFYRDAKSQAGQRKQDTKKKEEKPDPKPAGNTGKKASTKDAKATAKDLDYVDKE